MNNIFRFFRLFLIAVFLFSAVIPVDAHGRDDGKYSIVVDESGNTVYTTAWLMQVGDQVLTENNKRYEVIAIDGDTAKAKLIGEVDLAYYSPESNLLDEFAEFFGLSSVAQAQEKGKIAVYHTHSDESYLPTDNKESITGAGGIYKVGQAFKSALEKNGLTVALSEAKHDPHDNMAYERSRRTAMALIKNDKPDAVFDVHRDAVPPEVYKGTINGQEVTKLQLVVGKHGPTGKQIEEYALQIKAAADKKHPGLVKGIFFAKGGDYNQDLHPRSMLIEAGAHTNDRAAAEKGIAMFADVVPTVLGGAGAGGTTQTPPAANNANKAAGLGAGTTGGTNPTQSGIMGAAGGSGFSGAAKSIALIIGLVVLGSAAFLYLSTGSWKEAKSKLRQFVTTEFANFLGPQRKIDKDKKLSEMKKKRKD